MFFGKLHGRKEREKSWRHHEKWSAEEKKGQRLSEYQRFAMFIRSRGFATRKQMQCQYIGCRINCVVMLIDFFVNYITLWIKNGGIVTNEIIHIDKQVHFQVESRVSIGSDLINSGNLFFMVLSRLLQIYLMYFSFEWDPYRCVLQCTLISSKFSWIYRKWRYNGKWILVMENGQFQIPSAFSFEWAPYCVLVLLNWNFSS